MKQPVLVWLLLSLIWGTTWLGIKLGLEGLPPFTFAAFRFVVAVLPLLILLLVRRKGIDDIRREWRLISGTGMLTITVNYGLIFWAENHISSGLTAILYSVFPLFGLSIAHFHLPQERMTWMKTVGVVSGILGVALVFANEIMAANLKAVFAGSAVIVAAFGTAYAGVMIKQKGSHIDPLALTVGQMVVGLVPLLVIGVWSEGNPFMIHWKVASVLALLYLALVGSALAFVLIYWLMQHMDVTKTQLIPFGSTFVAVLLGWLVLGETMSARTLAGGACILVGLVLSVKAHRRKSHVQASITSFESEGPKFLEGTEQDTRPKQPGF